MKKSTQEIVRRTRGRDTYVVDNTGDAVTETTNAGWDTVQSQITYTLGANLESLTLTGTANINGTGNAVGNTINGNGGDNLLSGGAGTDTLNGGAGADTLSGGADDDSLYGGAGNDTLDGGTGADYLQGDAGVDVMAGGAGDDYYVVDDSGDTVTENLNEGNDRVYSSATYALGANIEWLVLSGTDNINGTGNALNNLINGNSGNNTLDGGAGNDIINGWAGADTLMGGAGNDTYTVDNIGDVIIENLNAGEDFVSSTVSYTLSDNVENLSLSGQGNIGTGNAQNNSINGYNAIGGNGTLRRQIYAAIINDGKAANDAATQAWRVAA